MPLCPGAAACQLAIRRTVSLLPGSAGCDLGFLLIDPAKPNIAVGPCWASGDRPAIYLRICDAGRTCQEGSTRSADRGDELATSKKVVHQA